MNFYTACAALAATLLIIYLLWVHFVAIMHLMHMRDDGLLTRSQKAIGYTALAVGLVLDVALQVLISALFLELPREWTVSGRLWRLSNGTPGWRQRLALKLRTALLDTADPSGTHRG